MNNNKITATDYSDKLASYAEYISAKKKIRRIYEVPSEYNIPKYEYGGISKEILGCLNKYGNTIISVMPYFEQLDKIWHKHYNHEDDIFSKHMTNDEIIARIAKCENHMIKQFAKNIGKPVTLRYVKPSRDEDILEGHSDENNAWLDRGMGFFVIQA